MVMMRHNILYYIIAFHLGSTENNNHNITILKGSSRLRRLFVILRSYSYTRTHKRTGPLCTLPWTPILFIYIHCYTSTCTHTHARMHPHTQTMNRFRGHCTAHNCGWDQPHRVTRRWLWRSTVHSLAKLWLNPVTLSMANKFTSLCLFWPYL